MFHFVKKLSLVNWAAGFFLLKNGVLNDLTMLEKSLVSQHLKRGIHSFEQKIMPAVNKTKKGVFLSRSSVI